MDRLARIRHPAREQEALHLLARDPDCHVPEVDLSFDSRQMRLGDERLRRIPPRLHPDPVPAASDIGTDDLIRHLSSLMLIDGGKPKRALLVRPILVTFMMLWD
ncbi:hypothetical protein GCM10023075_69970 [Streptosporangium album]